LASNWIQKRVPGSSTFYFKMVVGTSLKHGKHMYKPMTGFYNRIFMIVTRYVCYYIHVHA